ncbi:MAG: DUF3298 domain-containing protein [Fulvivirga sp.]
MKKYLTLGALLFLISCTPTAKDEADKQDQEPKLTIDSDSIKRRFGECKADSSIYCTQVNFTYPVFDGSSVALSLNEVFEKEALQVYLKDSINSNLASHADDFVADYKSIKERFDKAFGWQSSLNSQVVRSDSNLLVIETIVEVYTGGAHGIYEVYYLNLAADSGKALRLKDVFTPGYDSYLNKLIKSKIGDANDVSLEGTYYNSNFGLLEDGVKFYYNAYEIAPYASGPTEILISYQDLDGILKNEYK